MFSSLPCTANLISSVLRKMCSRVALCKPVSHSGSKVWQGEFGRGELSGRPAHVSARSGLKHSASVETVCYLAAFPSWTVAGTLGHLQGQDPPRCVLGAIQKPSSAAEVAVQGIRRCLHRQLRLQGDCRVLQRKLAVSADLPFTLFL